MITKTLRLRDTVTGYEFDAYVSEGETDAQVLARSTNKCVILGETNLEDGSRLVAIETVKQNELVRLVRNGKPTQMVYFAKGYSREDEGYVITKYNDINESRCLKKGTMVYVGFTY